MMNSVGTQSRSWQIILIVALVYLCAISSVTGVRVLGSIVEKEMSPGETFLHTINLSLSAQEEATDLVLRVDDLGNSLSGGLIAISEAENQSPYSARPFITLDKYSVHLEPKKYEVVTATIKIPSNVTVGGRYAMINLYTPPKGGGAVVVVTAVNIPIALTIKGAKISKKGNITDIFIPEAVVGKSSVISTIVKNTGNYYIVNAINDVNMTDSNGKLIFNSSIQSGSKAIIPTYSVQYDVPINTKLSVGTYLVTSKVMNSDKTILDEKTQAIEIKKPYEPPFTEVSITLSPSASSVLATPDGTKSVGFPAGSVFDAINILMRPVAVDQIPTIPSNVIIGETVFSLEGLSGLLSKDASITIKYSQKDLETAGGNPQKLVIARYDKLENQWVFMPTGLDITAGTLTTKTNRLSIWAVMVMEGQVPRPGETAVPGTTTTKTPGLTIGIAFGALAILFIGNRWRKR